MRQRRSIPIAALVAVLLGVTASAQAEVKVTNEPGCKIKIEMFLEFYGPGATDSIIAVWKSDIESKWSGLKDKSGWCDVQVVVTTKKRAESDPATAGYDQVKVVQSPDGKHTSKSQNGGIGSDRSAEWDDHDTGSVAAHEAGHLMGLDGGCEEGYEETKSGPDQSTREAKIKPGREKSIMGSATCTQRGIQWDIEKILEKAGISCPDSCCRGKGSTTTNGGGSATTPPPSGSAPKEPGTTGVVEPDTQPHSTLVQVPDALGGGTVAVSDFAGSCQVEWGPALDPEADCLADSNIVPIAVRQLQYNAPSFLLPDGTPTGPNFVTLRPEPRALWETTGRLNWATGQFELVMATQVVNDIYPPSEPLQLLGIVTGFYEPASRRVQYHCASWFSPDQPTDVDDLLRDGVRGGTLSLLALPSPARRRSVVAFNLPGAGQTTLDVYDVRGRLVRRLESRVLQAGPHLATWDLRDGGGRPVPAGIYLYKLSQGSRSVTRKLVVLR